MEIMLALSSDCPLHHLLIANAANIAMRSQLLRACRLQLGQPHAGLPPGQVAGPALGDPGVDVEVAVDDEDDAVDHRPVSALGEALVEATGYNCYGKHQLAGSCSGFYIIHIVVNVWRGGGQGGVPYKESIGQETSKSLDSSDQTAGDDDEGPEVGGDPGQEAMHHEKGEEE